jgi:hypothetical protein
LLSEEYLQNASDTNLGITLNSRTKQAVQRASTRTALTPDGIVRVKRGDIVDSIEKGARQRTGLSAKVMLRRYRNGKLTDPCRVTDLIALSNLLRKNDPILAE